MTHIFSYFWRHKNRAKSLKILENIRFLMKMWACFFDATRTPKGKLDGNASYIFDLTKSPKNCFFSSIHTFFLQQKDSKWAKMGCLFLGEINRVFLFMISDLNRSRNISDFLKNAHFWSQKDVNFSRLFPKIWLFKLFKNMSFLTDFSKIKFILQSEIRKHNFYNFYNFINKTKQNKKTSKI